MKKIAIVSPQYFFPVPALYGGACEELMTILINEHAQQDNDIELTIVQPIYSKEKMNKLNNYSFKNVKIIYLKNNYFYNFFAKVFNKIFKIFKIKHKLKFAYDKQVIKFLNKNHFDKIIFEADISGNLSKLKNNSPDNLYIHIHTAELEKNIYGVNNLIGVSNFISNNWRKELDRLNKSEVKTLTWPNAVNEKKFNKTISEEEKLSLKEHLGFSKNDFIVVFCGRIIEVKGIKELIQATTLLNDNCKLLIVGSPKFSKKKKTKYLEEVEELVNQNRSKIKFTGYIPNNELYKYYQLADLQVIPSLWEEAAGLVAIEGMMSKLPQIITNSGGLPEFTSEKGRVMVKKENNLVEQLAKEIELLMKDKERLTEMARENFEYAKNFTQKIYYENFINLMEDKND